MGRYRLAELLADRRVPVVRVYGGPQGYEMFHAANEEENAYFAHAVRSVERFDVTAAVDWYNTDDAVSSDLREFLPLRMPFPDLWAEFTEPVPTGEDLIDGKRFHQVGVLVSERPVPDAVMRLDIPIIHEKVSVDRPEGATHLIVAAAMFEVAGMVVMPIGAMLVWVTEAGGYVDCSYLTLPSEGDRLDSWDRSAIRPALFGLALANVRGAEMSQARVAGAPSRKKRRQKRSRLAYRVISLPGTRACGTVRRPGGAHGLIPQHLVRGHFATYTDDAPLFGKRTGTYWRMAHVRGNPDRGTTAKDYKVGPVGTQ